MSPHLPSSDASPEPTPSTREKEKQARQIQIAALEAKMCEGTITPAEQRRLVALLKEGR